MNAEQPAFDIAIAGLGIVLGRDMTLQTREILRRCNTVFVLDNGYGVDPYLGGHARDVVHLNTLYQNDQPRRKTYRQMAAAVLAAAVDNPPVAFVSYGHPKVFCFPSTLIRRASGLLNLRTITVPAVSALDALLVDVNYDFGTGGLQMYDATDALLHDRPLQADVPCVLWQVTWIAEPRFRSQPADAERFMDLQEYLLKFYPASHEVLSVFSRTHPALRSIVERHRVGDLAEALARGAQSGTLFIPPARRREVARSDLADRLR